MTTGRRPDPKRRKNKAPYSRYLKVEAGKSYGGWMAGEVFGCYSHRSGETKPCRANVTEDALKCPFCEAQQDAVWRGWVPLWDEDWNLRHAVINEDQLPTVEVIDFRAKIVLSKDKNPASPTTVREKVQVNRELSTDAQFLTPVVMLDVCLTLWKDSALAIWCDANRERLLGTKPVQLPPILKSNGKPFSPGMQAAARKYTPPSEKTVDSSVDAITARLKNSAARLKPSTNGNGKHE